MKLQLSKWLVGACAASFLAVGLPYWQIPYAEVEVPTSLMTPALVVVALAAAIARALGGSRFVVCVLAVAATIPAVVMVRVVVDTAADPTSHNLWPFEVFLAGFVGVMVAALGTAIGSIPGLRANIRHE
ncbi:MAG: hypothetical protein L0Z51_08920 [Candidatus Latescibacteria bacterium]|nr:hypothetical protein [Candidatus Latescibacterota bacterium]